jgi:hypothetical protein
MRKLTVILWLLWPISILAQSLNLTSFQHEIRWLDELRFHPLVKYTSVSNHLLHYTASVLSRKWNTETYTVPDQVDYRNITKFGKPRMMLPGKTINPDDYQASVLSFITRATAGNKVYWNMKVEVTKNGKTVYQRENSHELVRNEPGVRWFNDSSFMEHFSILFEELIELRPPLAQKYEIGKGVDYAELMKKESASWKVDQKNSAEDFGLPVLGPYTTFTAGRLDTSVIRSKKVSGNESSISIDGKSVSFDQFKTIDISRQLFCFLTLGSGIDTARALFSVSIQRTGPRRTVLSELLSNEDLASHDDPLITRRNVTGVILADSSSWDFKIQQYNFDGTLTSGTLWHDGENYPVFFRKGDGTNWQIIIKTITGEYLAILEKRRSSINFHIQKDLDAQTRHVFATFFAVLLSTKNVR